MRHRSLLSAALAAMLVLAPGLALPALGASAAPEAGAVGAYTAATPPKVVIVGGATPQAPPPNTGNGDQV